MHLEYPGKTKSQRVPAMGRRCAQVILTLACVPQLVHAQSRLSLQDAVRIGLAHAPAAQISADQVAVQRAQVAQARLRPNPRLYLQSEDLSPWEHSFSFPDSTEDYAYLSQTFEIDGKRGKRIAYADSGVARSEAEHALALRQIAAGIASAYWMAAATRDEAVEWRHQLADFDRIVKYQTSRVQAGAAAGVDLLRTQIERDRVALSLAQAERSAEAACIELARQTASLSVEKAALTDAVAQERPVDEMPLETAVDQRPDVAAARNAVREARSDVRLQHANAVPDLDLLGGYKRNVGTDTAYGGLQIDLPLFNRNQGGIAAASAGEQLAEDQLSYTQLNARSEIAAALSDYQREQALVRDTVPGMEQRAVRNASIISDAYRSGGADLLRYLDAERVLIDTRLLSIETWADYQKAVDSLRLAYGEQP
jgi:cobalt-zinc-cadmium efflux system outer membrane protein